jgi:hypothetical protein
MPSSKKTYAWWKTGWLKPGDLSKTWKRIGIMGIERGLNGTFVGIYKWFEEAFKNKWSWKTNILAVACSGPIYFGGHFGEIQHDWSFGGWGNYLLKFWEIKNHFLLSSRKRSLVSFPLNCSHTTLLVSDFFLVNALMKPSYGETNPMNTSQQVGFVPCDLELCDFKVRTGTN